MAEITLVSGRVVTWTKPRVGVDRYPRRRLVRLCEAQNHRCCYCGIVMRLETGEPFHADSASIEHVVPQARGGRRTAWENQVAACRSCNMERGEGWPILGLANVEQPR